MRTATTSLLLFALVFTLASFSYAHEDEGHRCTHDDKPRPEPEFLDIDEDFQPENQEGRTLASYSNMRMVGYYNLLGTGSYRNYIEKDLAPAVLAFFQASLKVKYPVSGQLKLSSSSLCGVSTPSSLKSGINADYMIMFNSELDTSSNWVAESYTCYLATGTKRPLVALTTFNRNLLKDATGNVLLHEKNTYLLLHEMTHTLGFSSNLYKYFLDTNGKTRSGHIKSMKLDGATSLVLDLPPLTQKLKNHFGCSTLAGAYMENSGSSATANSHFERRQFGAECLTSGLVYQQSYSEFTFALLEGTGWYVPDYDFADPHFFGQGQGCGFLTQSCSSSGFNYEGFCKSSSRGCTAAGRGGGSCNSDTRSDGCKFIQPNINYDCDNSNADDYARLPSLQAFGRSAYSKCFTGSLSTSKSASTTSFCFKYTCRGSGTSTVVDVQVGTQTVTCREEGTMSVTGYYGSVNCPDPLNFCNTVGKASCPRNCMGRGNCVSGKCSCYSGFTGKDCGLRS